MDSFPIGEALIKLTWLTFVFLFDRDGGLFDFCFLPIFQKFSRIALLIAICMDLLSAFSASATIIFFLMRVIWGIAMGITHAISISSIAHYDNYKHGYGIYVGLQFIVSGIALYIVPVYSDLIGVMGFFIGFAVLDFMAFLATKSLTTEHKHQASNNKTRSGLSAIVTVPALLAIIGFTLLKVRI